MKRLWLAAGLTLLIAAPAYSYGRQGHQAVGETARLLLNDRARAGVRKIMRGSDNLAGISVWPDDIKAAARGKGPLVNDGETWRFNEKFPDNGNWHFVNLPLGASAYSLTGRFSAPTDIIHKINQCIETLEASGRRRTVLSKLQALRFLVHLVGDLHQPLHVATGYYRFDAAGQAQMITAPLQAQGRPHDAGGNLLSFGDNKEDNLHALWDFTLVERVTGSDDSKVLSSRLRNAVQPAAWSTPGDYHEWPARWATDSLIEARSVYQGITFGVGEFDTDKRLRKIPVQLPASYLDDQGNRALTQLSKAAFRLADLLNHIQWQ